MNQREIKFRGLDQDGNWHYFGVFGNDDLPAIRKETLGEWTGLKDKNGKEIYEGDVFKVANNQEYKVVWLQELEYEEKCAGWGLEQIKGDIPGFLFDTFAISNGEVIGNIHENSELLK